MRELTIPAYAQEGICKIIKQITKRKIMILLYICPYQNAIRNTKSPAKKQAKKQAPLRAVPV